MGQFRIEITAVGGHGCEREVKDGGKVYGCGRIGCPDCEIRDLLLRWRLKNTASIERATLTHWPGTPQEVIDDLVEGTRRGSF
jgi:hypothetical protein